MAFTVGEYQDIFLEEADEQLQELNQNLLELEKNTDDLEIINNIFRAAHSLKSSAAFVGLNDLSDLAHKMENLLQGIRDRTIGVSSEIIDLLFKCFDLITSVINSVASGVEPTQDLMTVIDEIQRIGDRIETERLRDLEDVKQVTIPKTTFAADEVNLIKEGLGAGISCNEIIVFMDPRAIMKVIKAKLILNNLERIGRIVKTIPDLTDTDDEDSIQSVFKVIALTEESDESIMKACDVDMVYRVDMKRISLSRVEDKLALRFHEKQTLLEERGDNEENGRSESERESAALKRLEGMRDMDEYEYRREDFDKKKSDKRSLVLKTVKVSIDKLDSLLNNVGELVIANSGFYRLYEDLKKEAHEKSIINEFKSRMEQMSRIAKDLQSAIMKTRMVPIGQVFSRFNRLVRDLAHEFSKNVRLVVKGEDTELDKKVIDVIGEPLMHIIRNAIDHGIEPEELRRELRKPEVATITLNAYQGGNQIFVEVSDDGRGLNIEEIKTRAIELGMATSEMIANMDDEDIHEMIFNPGFSTARIITDVSGRGVGMNVVKEIVNEINGNISIETEPGMGTRFIMNFPLTLAIIPAIMVKVANEMYAIPLSDVTETIKIAESDVTTIEGHEVINLRGEILSLLRLNEFIGIESSLEDGKKIPVVIVGYGNRKIGLLVDFLEGKQEIVIKSLEQNYTTVEGLAGASILGDGSICLILDISSMMNKVISEQEYLSRRDRRRIAEVGTRMASEAVESAEEVISEDLSDEGVQVEERVETVGVSEEAMRLDDVRDEEERQPAVKEDIVYEREKAAPVGAVERDEETERFKDERPSGELTDEVEGQGDVEIRRGVKEALNGFREELRESIKSAVDRAEPDEYIKRKLQINTDDIERMQILANTGIANAAESLSKILNKRIGLSIPDIRVMPLEKIPESIGEIDNVYIGVYMPLVGDIRGTILFSLVENSGYELIRLLYETEERKIEELDEDGESALIEVTNIIGSSIINVFSEKIKMSLKPTVPTLVHDYMQSILDSILILHNISNDFALIMSTEFYYQDDTIMGNLLMLPEIDSLKLIVDKLRE